MTEPLPIFDADEDSCAPTRQQIYVGLGWTKDMLVKRLQDIRSDMDALVATHKALVEAFDKQSMVSVKLASEAVASAALSLQGTIHRTHGDASVLARKAKEHLTRSHRI